MAQISKEDVIKYIEGITVLELAELVKDLENK
ncbi:MAG: 50S ribosomal protein L7/L12, partial [Deltaproteobacteria bacterium]